MIEMDPQMESRTIEPKSAPIDCESITDQVWQDMGKTVPRTIVAQTVDRLLVKYRGGAIQTFVPVLVRREARELLRTANLTEIEAKFKVTDPQLFWNLQTIDELAGFELSPPRSKPVWDVYLDSDQRRILRAGFCCRRRETGDGIEITLKSLDRAEGAIHSRNEWQVNLLADRPPAEWPESQVRDRVQRIIGAEPLQPLFRLEQTRIVRQLSSDGQVLAEMSMDNVTVTAGNTVQVFHELEIELLPAVPEEMLVEVVEQVQARWQLAPEPLSKFERGLILLDIDS